MKEYDCVVIGHYESDSNLVANLRRLTAEQSGAYHEVFTNSVKMNGRRTSYTDMLNIGLEAATGRKWSLHPLDVPHLGVFYLTSYLCRRGFHVQFVNFCNSDEERLLQAVANAKMAAVTTTYYLTDESIIKLVRRIKSRCNDIPVIAGGPRIFGIYQSVPDRVKLFSQLKSLGADIYIIESQGEKTLAALVEAMVAGNLDLSKIPNLIYRDHDGGMQETQRVVEQNDLNKNMVD